MKDGTTGIIMSIQVPVYLFYIPRDKICFFHRNGEVATQNVNFAEYRFKLALSKRKFKEVDSLLNSGDIPGSAPLNYLQQKGFPEVALKFENNHNTRFKLALASRNVEEAMYAALQLKEKPAFLQLARESILQGNYQVGKFLVRGNNMLF
jgi:coatomer subunit alpha